MVDPRFRWGEHMTFAGMARNFHAIDEMGHILGGFDGLLPYSKGSTDAPPKAECLTPSNYCTGKYMASLKKVREAVCDEQTE
jgi:hypothetical protein